MNNKRRIRLLIAASVVWLIMGIFLLLALNTGAYNSALTAVTVLYAAVVPFGIGVVLTVEKFFTE